MRPVWAFTCGVVASLIAGATASIFWSHYNVTKIHKLEFPLLIESEVESGSFHILPKGTTLYFDQSYPEGFSRYKVYINIDRMPLKLEPLNDPTAIIPIEARAPDSESLKKLLRDYPLTKEDLVSILNSQKLSKEQIREILEDYLR